MRAISPVSAFWLSCGWAECVLERMRGSALDLHVTVTDTSKTPSPSVEGRLAWLDLQPSSPPTPVTSLMRIRGPRMFPRCDRCRNMADMVDKLRGVEAKLSRAKAHIQEFEERQHEFTSARPYTARVDFRPDLGDAKNFLAFIDSVEPIPDDVQTIIGDALFNLRSALDHLAWQLVLASGGQPTARTAFPIFEDRLTRQGALRPLEIAGEVDPGAQDLVESFQPYRRLADPTDDPLWC